jgi:hypothetical protein
VFVRLVVVNPFYAMHEISPFKILVLLILMHLASGKISRINRSCRPLRYKNICGFWGMQIMHIIEYELVTGGFCY